MNNTTVNNEYNPAALRLRGMNALVKELGPVGMARFFMDYGLGSGDYTAEREELLSGITMEDFDRWLAEKHESTTEK
jgi:hypothetical protein